MKIKHTNTLILLIIISLFEIEAYTNTKIVLGKGRQYFYLCAVFHYNIFYMHVLCIMYKFLVTASFMQRRFVSNFKNNVYVKINTYVCLLIHIILHIINNII